MLQLSGVFSTQRRQRSPENVSREATLKRTLDGHGNEAPKSPKDHLTLLRNQLPSARRRDEDGDAANDTYETDVDVLSRARQSVCGNTPGSQLASELEDLLVDKTATPIAAPPGPPPPLPPTVRPPLSRAGPPPPPPPPAGARTPSTAPLPIPCGSNPLAAGLGQFKLRKTKGVEELENEKRAKALEAQQVDYPSPNRMTRLFEQDAAAHVILVDFFAYSCTNCIRTVPILRDWMAKYHRFGLRIVAFHRPEFEFETSIRNVANFVQSFAIDYPVGLDNDSNGWMAWKVESWPTHFLVPRPVKSGAPLVKSGDPHIGDRGHDVMEKAILEALLARTSTAEAVNELRAMRDAVVPLNRDVFHDMEFFLGTQHSPKNTPAADKCADGVCAFVPKQHRVQHSTVQSDIDSPLLEFGRNGHTGYATLGAADTEWVHTAEFCAPTKEVWAIELMFKLGGFSEADTTKVSLYMVAEPQEGSVSNIVAAADGAEVRCVVGAADRHYLGRWANGSTVQIAGDAALRVYSFYITTEVSLGRPSALDPCPPVRPAISDDAESNESDVASPRQSLDGEESFAATHAAPVHPAFQRLQADTGLERRPTGRRAKPQAVQPAAEDDQYIMPEASGRSTSLRIFAAYGEMYPDKSRAGVFTVRESTKLVGAYTLDICGEGERVVHMMVQSGPGPQIQAGDTVFPSLSAFVDHYRTHPLDMAGMGAKGMSHITLGECVSRGFSLGGGSRPSESDDMQLPQALQAGQERARETRRIYHTVVVRRLRSGGLPFVAERVLDRHVMCEVANPKLTTVRTGDIILGINGQAVDAVQAAKCLKRAPKAFTMDVERVFNL